MCETDCNHGSGCGHEGGCPGDPCSIRVVRPERQGGDVVAVSQPAAAIAIIPAAVKQSWVESVCSGTLELPCGRKLPFPPSDLPLLI